MAVQLLIPIQSSLGFALRDLRPQRDYVNHLAKNTTVELTAIGESRFKEIFLESFSEAATKIRFISQQSCFLDNLQCLDEDLKVNLESDDILTGIKAVQKMRTIYGEKYLTVTDNLGQHYPIPEGTNLFVKEEIIADVKQRLLTAANEAITNSKITTVQVIFILFSGIKAFQTEYGRNASEKENIANYMTFPFEEIIPAISEIQSNLLMNKIIAVPICIQYGDLCDIQKTVLEFSKNNKLCPFPSFLQIDWNQDIERQVGMFHAIKSWSSEIGLSSIAIVHGSSCLHLIEECVDSNELITFYATHSKELSLENDGRIYHQNVADSGCKPLYVVKPGIQNSHDYKLVAEKIVEKVCDFYSQV